MSERASGPDADDGSMDVVSTVDTGSDDDILTPLSVAGMLWNADVADSTPTYTAEPAPTQQSSGPGDALGGLLGDIGSHIPHVDISAPQIGSDAAPPAAPSYDATPAPTPTPTIDYSPPSSLDYSAPAPAPDTSSFS